MAFAQSDLNPVSLVSDVMGKPEPSKAAAVPVPSPAPAPAVQSTAMEVPKAEGEPVDIDAALSDGDDDSLNESKPETAGLGLGESAIDEMICNMCKVRCAFEREECVFLRDVSAWYLVVQSVSGVA